MGKTLHFTLLSALFACAGPSLGHAAEGTAYYDGIAAAAANGGVVKVIKRPATEAAKPSAPVILEATTWVDPPARALKPAGSEADRIGLDSAECRNSKLAFADLPAKCKSLLNEEALGLRGSGGSPENFCRLTFAGDDAGYDRCLGKGASEIDTDAVMLNVLGRKGTGNLEPKCRRASAGSDEAFRRCLGGGAMISGRRTRAKIAAPSAPAPREAPATSMSVE